MVLIQPPSYCESAECYTPQQDRLLWRSIICTEGVQTGFEVAPGVGMNVTVQAGRAFIQGDTTSDEGMYWVASTDQETLPIGPASATDPRLDLVVARINSDCTWSLAVIPGTPAPNPQYPPLPASALRLAGVRVEANATAPTIFEAFYTIRAKLCQDLVKDDTGWVPLTSFAPNWTNVNSGYRNINGLIQLDLQATYTGATVPSNTSGNIPDIALITLPLAARPQHQRVPGDFVASSPGSLVVNVNGTTVITHLYPNGSLEQNSTLICTMFYYRT